MPKSTHRGDTLPKRVARFITYAQIRAWMGEDRFSRSRFCFLASREGGDASVLKAFGVEPRQQLAADLDLNALEEFSRRFPSVPTFHGDVTGFKGERFDVVFLDLCNNLSDKTLDLLSRGVSLVKRREDSVYAYAIMRGRDPLFTARIENGRAENMAAMSRMTGVDMSSIMREAAPVLSDGRGHVVYEHLMAEATKLRIALFSICGVGYSAKDPSAAARKGGPGTPMMIRAFKVHAGMAATSRARFMRKAKQQWMSHSRFVQAYAEADAMAFVDGCAPFPLVLNRNWASRLGRLIELGPLQRSFHGFEHNALLSSAIQLADSMGVDSALAFNLSAAKIAAVRAHSSMGTYDKQHDLWKEKQVDEIERQLVAYAKQDAAE